MGLQVLHHKVILLTEDPLMLAPVPEVSAVVKYWLGEGEGQWLARELVQVQPQDSCQVIMADLQPVGFTAGQCILQQNPLVFGKLQDLACRILCKYITTLWQPCSILYHISLIVMQYSSTIFT